MGWNRWAGLLGIVTSAMGALGCGSERSTGDAPDAGVVELDLARTPRASALASFVASRQAEGAADPAYHFRVEAGEAVALQPTFGLRAEMSVAGARLRAGRNVPDVVFRTERAGCDGELRDTERVAPHSEKNRVEYRRTDATEWWLNGPLGLEQGFVVHRAPCAAPSVLRFEVSAEGLRPELDAKAHNVRLVDESGITALRYKDAFAHDAGGHELVAKLSVEDGRIVLSVEAAGARYPIVVDPLVVTEEAVLYPEYTGDGESLTVPAVSGDTAVIGSNKAAYVFVRNGTSWTQQARLDVPGRSVAIVGDTAIVGNMADSTYGSLAGAAHVFVRTGTTWAEQQKLYAADAAPGDYFGESVALGTETAVVGADGDDDNGSGSGSAYVFVRTGTTWSQQQKILAADGTASDGFGTAVALSGDTVLAGADWDSAVGNYSGSAYVFVRSGTTWTQQQKLTASDAAADDHFGEAVALSGDTALVGASGNDDAGSSSGSAYVFTRSGTTWSEQQKLVTTDAASGDVLGRAVALSGSLAVVGAPFCDAGGSGAGAVYTFSRSGVTWTQQQKLLASDAAAGDNLGVGVAVDGTTLLASAAFQSPLGSTYVFADGGSGFAEQAQLATTQKNQAQFGGSVAVNGTTMVTGARYDRSSGAKDQGAAYVYVQSGTTWPLQQKLLASDGAADQRFGTSVAIDANELVVGATDAVVAGSAKGAAYVFARAGATWSEQSKLVASDGTAGAVFGATVALQQDTLAVGATYDNQKGAVYVFARSGSTWIQQQKLTTPDAANFDLFGASLALDGDTLAIGMPYGDVGANSGQGAVYVFTRAGSTWTQEAKLVAPVGAAADHLGGALDVQGDWLWAGADGDDAKGLNAGSAHVFARSGTSWTHVVKVTASDGAAGDAFGRAVSLDGGAAVVGGVGTITAAGSAHVFLEYGGNWQESGKLTGTNSAPGNAFGASTSVFGRIVAVGAVNEGDFVASGAVHMFSLAGGYPGESCSAGSSCASGFCSDGVCCNSACSGSCDVCTKAKGAPADGACTILGPSFPGEPACAPQTCNGVSATCADCTTDGECPSGKYCDAAGKCQTKKTQGAACNTAAGADCKVASCAACATAGCVDGYCCDTTCGAACDVCSTALGASTNGTCSTAPVGTNTTSCASPQACNGTSLSCPSGCTGDTDCATTHYCDKNNTCQPRKVTGQTCDPSAGTECLLADCRLCQSGNCVDGFCCNTACGGECDRCDNSGSTGTCSPAADGATPSPACSGGYLCDGSATGCPSSCASDADCATTHFCSSNACVSKKTLGQACTAATECGSGFCADGVCCNTACDQTCMACAAANKQSGTNPGTCDVAKQGTNPNNKCVVDSSNVCGEIASCKGSAAECAKAAFGTSCGPTTCNAGSVSGKVCDGTGTCVDQSNASCSPYVCSGGACTTPCTGDTDCVSGYYCSSGTCVAKSDNGLACSTASQCKSSFCVDTVCCDAPCTGQCEACDASGSVGQCKAVLGDPHGSRPACSGTGACQGSCDGADPTKCAYPGLATTCAAASCTGDVVQPAGTCDSTGSCSVPATKNCAPYACDATAGACKTSCAADADCAQGAKCDTTSGKCAPVSATCQDSYTVKLANGQTQSCSPYKCVGGACQQQCATSGDCAPGYECQGTACVPASDAGSGGGSGTGGTGGTAGSGGKKASSGGDDGGCGCRVAGERRNDGALLLLLALGVALRRRRRLTSP